MLLTYPFKVPNHDLTSTCIEYQCTTYQAKFLRINFFQWNLGKDNFIKMFEVWHNEQSFIKLWCIFKNQFTPHHFSSFWNILIHPSLAISNNFWTRASIAEAFLRMTLLLLFLSLGYWRTFIIFSKNLIISKILSKLV